MATPILYSYFQSSCSWRVRTALAFKNMKYESRTLPLLKDSQLAIVEYIDETRKEGISLIPKDPVKRATSRAIAQMVACDIQPVQNLRVLKKYGLDKKIEWGGHWINLGFTAIEKTLERTAGKYCVGDDITIADLCLVPQCFNAKRFDVDMSNFPIISRINETLMELPEFRVSHPFAQPDCPEELKKEFSVTK